MKAGASIFRVLLAVGWAVIVYVSVQAVRQMGMGAAGAVFIGDFHHPWRAQFNTDFTLHLLLVAAWMVYRTKPWILGVLFAFLAINLGGVFTLAYLFVVSLQSKGDIRKLLLGWQAEAAA